jgi:hypothetical protein
MSDGTISGNTVSSSSSSSASGGGVYVSSDRSFTMSGGTISGNIASYGGGVYKGSGTGFFVKQPNGIIYGSNESSTLQNTATSGNGHTAYVDSSPAKKCNTTAGTGITLDTRQNGSAGGWDQ